MMMIPPPAPALLLLLPCYCPSALLQPCLDLLLPTSVWHHQYLTTFSGTARAAFYGIFVLFHHITFHRKESYTPTR